MALDPMFGRTALISLLFVTAVFAGCLSDPEPASDVAGTGDADGAGDAGEEQDDHQDGEGTGDGASDGSTEQNEAPSAAFAITMASGAAVVGETISVDASESTDPDADTLSYAWDFGDGTTATGAKVDHAFETAGEHTIKLTVTDSGGLTDTREKDLPVANALPDDGILWNMSFSGALLAGNPIGVDAESLNATLMLAADEGVDHHVINLSGLPLDGKRLVVNLSWDAEVVANPLGGNLASLPDYDVYVYDAAGNGLTKDARGATAGQPEWANLTAANDLQHGDYKVLVWLYAGADAAYDLNVWLEA